MHSEIMDMPGYEVMDLLRRGGFDTAAPDGGVPGRFSAVGPRPGTAETPPPTVGLAAVIGHVAGVAGVRSLRCG